MIRAPPVKKANPGIRRRCRDTMPMMVDCSNLSLIENVRSMITHATRYTHSHFVNRMMASVASIALSSECQMMPVIVIHPLLIQCYRNEVANIFASIEGHLFTTIFQQFCQR